MNNLSPLGLITCFIFSVVLNGAFFKDHFIPDQSNGSAYLVNRSQSIIYYKPESRKANPGLDHDAAYPLLPGQTLYAPFDAIVMPSVRQGSIFRIPTGSKIIINEEGLPQPANLIARGGLLLKAYGNVQPPSPQFAKLANPKPVLYKAPDIKVRRS